MKRISVDNGHSFVSIEEALSEISIDTMAVYMDDDTREAVAFELAPCSDHSFLRRYLEIAPFDLVIG